MESNSEIGSIDRFSRIASVTIIYGFILWGFEFFKNQIFKELDDYMINSFLPLTMNQYVISFLMAITITFGCLLFNYFYREYYNFANCNDRDKKKKRRTDGDIAYRMIFAFTHIGFGLLVFLSLSIMISFLNIDEEWRSALIMLMLYVSLLSFLFKIKKFACFHEIRVSNVISCLMLFMMVLYFSILFTLSSVLSYHDSECKIVFEDNGIIEFEFNNEAPDGLRIEYIDDDGGVLYIKDFSIDDFEVSFIDAYKVMYQDDFQEIIDKKDKPQHRIGEEFKKVYYLKIIMDEDKLYFNGKIGLKLKMGKSFYEIVNPYRKKDLEIIFREKEFVLSP